MEYEQALEQAIEYAMSDIDGCCRNRIYQVSYCMTGEMPPYPPPHLSTLARYVHALAYRVFNVASHPQAAPGWSGYSSRRYEYLRYIEAVLRLNNAIDVAAKSGKLKLRDRATGTVLTSWSLPSKEKAEALWKAIEPCRDDRAAAELLVGWAIWEPHFDGSIVVARDEFLLWLNEEGIATPGEAEGLLSAMGKFKWLKAMGFPESLPNLLVERAPTTPPGEAPAVVLLPDEQSAKTRNVWDPYALRRLLDESKEPGMTQEKLGEKYGVTRQRIGALLNEAKELVKPQKQTAFSAFARSNGKK